MSESVLTFIIGLVIIAVFLVPYILTMRRKDKKTRARLEETRSKGQDKALMQHPIINRTVCIGCGICVSVCPEGDVLGIVDGKSTIINGSHCVGHGLCAENCPVGAIEISLGDISEREDIPQLSDTMESSLAGVYLIGELSGMALIRNAIQHGITAVDAIQKQFLYQNPDNIDDRRIGIVGAGPAGLAATLRAIELGLSYILLDQDKPGGTILQYPRKKLTLVQPVSLPLYGILNKGEYTKEELLEIWESVIKEHAIELHTGYKLTGVEGLDGAFELKTTKGDFQVQKVILALGRRGIPRKLGVTGENLGKVMYKLMDAGTYKNNRVLVVGGGDSAIEAAIGLANQPGNHVTISYRKSNFFRLKARNEINIQQSLEKKLLDSIFDSVVTEIRSDQVELNQKGKAITLENDYVFIFAGGELPFPLLNSIGIEFGKSIESKPD